MSTTLTLHDDPVIWTWRGNLPVSQLEHYVQWDRSLKNEIRLNEFFKDKDSGMVVRSRSYTYNTVTGVKLGAEQDKLDEPSHGNMPMIFTSRGNMPIVDLEHEVVWDVTDQYAKVRDIYRADGEVVKESAHVIVLQAETIGAEQAKF